MSEARGRASSSTAALVLVAALAFALAGCCLMWSTAGQTSRETARETFLPTCSSPADSTLKCLTHSCYLNDPSACFRLVHSGDNPVRVALARSVAFDAVRDEVSGATTTDTHPVIAALASSEGDLAAAALKGLRAAVVRLRGGPSADEETDVLTGGWPASARSSAAIRAAPGASRLLDSLFQDGDHRGAVELGEGGMTVPELPFDFRAEQQPQATLMLVFSERPPVGGRPPAGYLVPTNTARPAGAPPDHPAYARCEPPLLRAHLGSLFRVGQRAYHRHRVYSRDPDSRTWFPLENTEALDPDDEEPSDRVSALRFSEARDAVDALPAGFGFFNRAGQWTVLLPVAAAAS